MFKIIFVALMKHIFILLPLTIVGWVILPFVLLFIGKTKEALPTIFKLWDNFSGPKVDGLSGDWPFRVAKGMGIKVEIGEWDGNPFWLSSTYKQTCGYWKLWWRRYVWLGWRNPVDFTKGIVLGYETTDISKYNETAENNGIYTALFMSSNGIVTLQEVYTHFWRYGLFGTDFIHRLRAGYKIQGNALYYQSTHPKYITRSFARFEFSYSPIYKVSKLEE